MFGPYAGGTMPARHGAADKHADPSDPALLSFHIAVCAVRDLAAHACSIVFVVSGNRAQGHTIAPGENSRRVDCVKGSIDRLHHRQRGFSAHQFFHARRASELCI
jgi:hypothetical protein